MIKSKRFSYTIFLPLMILMCLVACQVAQKVTPSLMPVVSHQSVSPTPTSLPEELRLIADELKGQNITIWQPWLDERGDQLSYLVEDFNQSNANNIRVDVKSWGGEMALSDALVEDFTGVSPLPDIFIARPEDAFSFQRAGLTLVALDDYLASQDWGLSAEDRADLIEPIWQLGDNNGIQYGIPAEIQAHFLFYNLTWGLELGFTSPPKNQEDFLLQVCKADRANLTDASKANDGTGGWLVANDSASMLAWLTGFGYQIPSQSPYLFNLAETKSTFDYLKSLVVKDCAWLGKQSTAYDYFAERYALVYSGTLADITNQRAAFSRTGSIDQWVLIPYPNKGEGSPTLVDGTNYFIIKSDPVHQMAAWQFLRWLNEPAQQDRLFQLGNALPNRYSVVKTLGAENNLDLIYSYVYQSLDSIQPLPHDADWRIARLVLEDASWQLFQPESRANQIPAILENLDVTIKEILALSEE